jgi:septum formation protein
MTLILASQSTSRRAMLDAAGVVFDVLSSGVDEDSLKTGLRADGISARNLADALAEFKALRLSQRRPGDLVLGCDSTVELDDGTMIDKAPDRATLAAQLRMMSGKTHRLYSAAVIVEGGRPVWRHVDRATLTMRPLSDAFIEHYLAAEGDGLLACVGGYRIEGRGAQLFSKIEGSQFTIMGLPLLNVLDYLRTRGVLAS